MDALGVIEDPRPKEEKRTDYNSSEIVSYTPIKWRKVLEQDWRQYPIFHQDGSSSCLAQAVSKTLGIENYLEEKKFVHFSARDIYSQRKNYPDKGMWFQDGMRIGYEKGVTLEQLMLSQNLSESEMNKSNDRKEIDKQIALVGKGGNYLAVPLNIEAIAQIIEGLGKPVVIGVKFGSYEWNKPVPQILVSQTKYHHAIVATNAILYDHQKCLVIEDSWGLDSGMNGRRIVSEEWFKEKRISAAWYFKALKNTWRDKEIKPAKPKWQFNKDLIFCQRNSDIEMLQKILKYEEMFPQAVDITGFYGAITARGVLEFQRKYKVASEVELDLVKGFRVGPKTRVVLNLKYI